MYGFAFREWRFLVLHPCANRIIPFLWYHRTGSVLINFKINGTRLARRQHERNGFFLWRTFHVPDSHLKSGIMYKCQINFTPARALYFVGKRCEACDGISIHFLRRMRFTPNLFLLFFFFIFCFFSKKEKRFHHRKCSFYAFLVFIRCF